ncbi:glycosyltransferase family 2 protein [Gloeocapsopsis dulcis]|uniref:Glucosyl transferase n=1 Tax=Gloeocapsopsis dulcis AAB1 = 1H9 TaxID=1433147 RepID=A0A6N8FTB4_9CHRO|nr:glycosyltransferase family 2 protein [Gloeocapsopsis dulcis]MUL35812.1 glucosyl transferase [Gloeocapsopsis dulcis AAB1 = 1H9]WNN87721.1 glycosyltransferase family 2 protein [Gloeocapsopsis dulcis]
MPPKVSVIIPVYNVEKYITATVSSVLAQTYSDFELLIIDDESLDRSIQICQQFTDSRIKIIHQKNRGLAGARNTGIRYAQGEYLAFLDGDDLWLPEKLEKHVTHLDHSPSVGVSFSCSAFIDEEGQNIGIYQMPKKLQGITPSYIICRNPIGNGSAPVIRKQVFEAIKFFKQQGALVESCYFDPHCRRSEDIECWVRIAIQTSWQFEGISEALTLYRINSHGLSANWVEQFESWQRVIEKIRAFAPELISQWEKPAKAYQLRYLARRAVTLRTPSMAVELINRSVTTYWRILLEEPRRTLLTWIAAYFLLLLPQVFYNQIEAIALKVTEISQKRYLIKQASL